MEHKDADFLGFLMSPNRVKRFHMRDVDPQTNASHQYSVAMIAWVIGAYCRTVPEWSWVNPWKLVAGALTHDLLESFTGDVDYFVKKSSEIRDAWKDLECRAKSHSNDVIPEWFSQHMDLVLGDLSENWSEIETNLLKVADYLECTWYCHKEVIQGNKPAVREFRQAYSATEEYYGRLPMNIPFVNNNLRVMRERVEKCFASYYEETMFGKEFV